MANRPPKGMRPCPATGGLISSVDCGRKRNSELSCPASRPFNLFGPAGYDLWLRLDGTWTPKAADWVVKCEGANEFDGVKVPMKIFAAKEKLSSTDESGAQDGKECRAQ